MFLRTDGRAAKGDEEKGEASDPCLSWLLWPLGFFGSCVVRQVVVGGGCAVGFGGVLRSLFNGGSAHSVGLVRPVMRGIGTRCPGVGTLDGSRLHTGAGRLRGCMRRCTGSRGTGVTRLGTGVRSAPVSRHRNVFGRVSGLRRRTLSGCRITLGRILPRIFTVMGSATHHFTRGRRAMIATASFSHRLTSGPTGSFIAVSNSGTVCRGR